MVINKLSMYLRVHFKRSARVTTLPFKSSSNKLSIIVFTGKVFLQQKSARHFYKELTIVNFYTVVGDNINIMKTTFEFNFDL